MWFFRSVEYDPVEWTGEGGSSSNTKRRSLWDDSFGSIGAGSVFDPADAGACIAKMMDPKSRRVSLVRRHVHVAIVEEWANHLGIPVKSRVDLQCGALSVWVWQYFDAGVEAFLEGFDMCDDSDSSP